MGAKTPLELALELLAARSRTEEELSQALLRRGVSQPDANAAVARLRELRYMDDREVAAARARRLLERGDAPRRAIKRLLRQGVSEPFARAAADEARDGKGDDELAASALARKLRGRPPADDREKRRLFRGLVARGHRPSAAARAVGIEWEGEDDVEED